MKQWIVALALGIAAVAASPAQAVPLRWTLYDVAFLDGGAATGSFEFDASTVTFSSINVTTTSGTSFAGGVYTGLAPGYGASAESVFLVTGALADYTGTPLLFLNPVDPMQDAGGAIPVVSTEYRCTDAACQTVSTLRTTQSGYVSTLPIGQGINVPEPASALLLGAGLLGLCLARKCAKAV